MHPPPHPFQQILYLSIIVKKKINADHFEFIIHAFEEDIPGFRFMYLSLWFIFYAC